VRWSRLAGATIAARQRMMAVVPRATGGGDTKHFETFEVAACPNARKSKRAVSESAYRRSYHISPDTIYSPVRPHHQRI
jgi:hypothetical protein